MEMRVNKIYISNQKKNYANEYTRNFNSCS